MKTSPIKFRLVLGCGRITSRLEVIGKHCRLYRGGDVVAALRIEKDGSASLMRGTIEDANEILYWRDRVLAETAYMRN